MKIFRKKDIKRMALAETKRRRIFEDEATQKTYVDGSGTPSDITTDANKALRDSPTSSSAVVPMSNYDNQTGNGVNTVKASSNNPQDIKKAISSVKPGTNYNLEIPRNESVDYLRDNSVSFTKREIREMFKR